MKGQRSLDRSPESSSVLHGLQSSLVSLMLFSSPNENKLEPRLGLGRGGGGGLQSGVYRHLHFLNSSLSLTHSSTFFPFY